MKLSQKWFYIDKINFSEYKKTCENFYSIMYKDHSYAQLGTTV